MNCAMGAFVFCLLIIQIQLFVFTFVPIFPLYLPIDSSSSFISIYSFVWIADGQKLHYVHLKSKSFEYAVCLASGQKLISFFKCCKWLHHDSVYDDIHSNIIEGKWCTFQRFPRTNLIHAWVTNSKWLYFWIHFQLKSKMKQWLRFTEFIKGQITENCTHISCMMRAFKRMF